MEKKQISGGKNIFFVCLFIFFLCNYFLRNSRSKTFRADASARIWRKRKKWFFKFPFFCLCKFLLSIVEAVSRNLFNRRHLPLREVKRVLSFPDGDSQFLPHNVQASVIGQLEIIDARHHRRQEIVCILVRLQSLPHHSQRRRQALET